MVSEFNNSFDIGLDGVDNVDIGEFNGLRDFDVDSQGKSQMPSGLRKQIQAQIADEVESRNGAAVSQGNCKS